jgi:hypothetical protein
MPRPDHPAINFADGAASISPFGSPRQGNP